MSVNDTILRWNETQELRPWLRPFGAVWNVAMRIHASAVAGASGALDGIMYETPDQNSLVHLYPTGLRKRLIIGARGLLVAGGLASYHAIASKYGISLEDLGGTIAGAPVAQTIANGIHLQRNCRT